MTIWHIIWDLPRRGQKLIKLLIEQLFPCFSLYFIESYFKIEFKNILTSCYFSLQTPLKYTALVPSFMKHCHEMGQNGSQGGQERWVYLKYCHVLLSSPYEYCWCLFFFSSYFFSSDQHIWFWFGFHALSSPWSLDTWGMICLTVFYGTNMLHITINYLNLFPLSVKVKVGKKGINS